MEGEYTGLIRKPYPDRERLSKVHGDKRGMDYSAGTLHPLYLPLDAAQTPKEFNIPGDVIYVDKLSTGTIKIRLDTSWARGFPLGANAAMSGTPFRSFMLEWDAQAGLIATLWVGYGINIVPPNQDITSIGSITNPVTVAPNSNWVDSPGTHVASSGSFVANTPVNIVAAASNTGGIKIHRADMGNNIVSVIPYTSFLLKATAPASTIDGKVYASSTIQGLGASSAAVETYFGNISQQQKMRFASGLRYDLICGQGAAYLASTSYDLL